MVPRLLQLVYLGGGGCWRYAPDEADLRAIERKLRALWEAIERALETGEWRPAQPAVRLVQPSGAVPRFGRHSAAYPLAVPPPRPSAEAADGLAGEHPRTEESL